MFFSYFANKEGLFLPTFMTCTPKGQMSIIKRLSLGKPTSLQHCGFSIKGRGRPNVDLPNKVVRSGIILCKIEHKVSVLLKNTRSLRITGDWGLMDGF